MLNASEVFQLFVLPLIAAAIDGFWGAMIVLVTALLNVLGVPGPFF